METFQEFRRNIKNQTLYSIISNNKVTKDIVKVNNFDLVIPKRIQTDPNLLEILFNSL